MQYTSILDHMSGSSTSWPIGSLADDLPTSDDVALPCQDVSRADLFFAEQSAQVEAAKALCQECPIRAQCLQGATSRGEPWGVWGGEVFVEGTIVARKRGRGRPRKDDPHAPARANPAA